MKHGIYSCIVSYYIGVGCGGVRSGRLYTEIYLWLIQNMNKKYDDLS